MKKIILLLDAVIFFLVLNPVFSQTGKVKMDESKIVSTTHSPKIQTLQKSGVFTPIFYDSKWRPLLNHTTSKNDNEQNEDLQKIKAAKAKLKALNSKTGSGSEDFNPQSVAPLIGASFNGNSNSGCPPDHTIAISNGGKVVSLVNANIEVFSTSGTSLYVSDLYSFYGNNPNIVNNLCDPKVIYDPGADRFIFYSQTCDGVSANSQVIISFSNSNDPAGQWTYYAFSGNPLNDNSWWDYPKLAISDNEVYVTGNLFFQSGSFNQVAMYQINKNDGYNGNNINYLTWTGISGSPFTLMPVGLGQAGGYGPGCYLVNSSSGGASTVNLYDLTADIGNNPQLNLYTINVSAYSPGGNAAQMGSTDALDIGDSRMQNGFYKNGIVHFALTSDIGQGWNGLYYGRIDVAAQTATNSTFGLSGTADYCYPAIASITNNSNKSVLISFMRSGSTMFPETRVVSCDDNFNWSSSVLVRQGDGFQGTCFDPNHSATRWGDYSGIARKFNTSNEVWVQGGYATASNDWGAWIAQVTDVVGINENDKNTEAVKVSPNPIIDLFNLSFTVDKSIAITVNINDENGKLVKELYKGLAQAGENKFSFNKGMLSSGIYFLELKHGQQIFRNEKISIVN